MSAAQIVGIVVVLAVLAAAAGRRFIRWRASRKSNCGW